MVPLGQTVSNFDQPPYVTIEDMASLFTPHPLQYVSPSSFLPYRHIVYMFSYAFIRSAGPLSLGSISSAMDVIAPYLPCLVLSFCSMERRCCTIPLLALP